MSVLLTFTAAATLLWTLFLASQEEHIFRGLNRSKRCNPHQLQAKLTRPTLTHVGFTGIPHRHLVNQLSQPYFPNWPKLTCRLHLNPNYLQQRVDAHHLGFYWYKVEPKSINSLIPAALNQFVQILSLLWMFWQSPILFQEHMRLVTQFCICKRWVPIGEGPLIFLSMYWNNPIQF